MKDKKVQGMVFAIIGGIFWGLAGCFGQYLFVHNHLNAQWLVSVRLTLAGLLLLSIVYLKEKNHVFDIWKNKKYIPSLFLFAIFGMGVCQLSYYSTVELSNAATATVIQYTGPALIMLYFCITFRRLPNKLQFTALVMSLAGVALLATKGDFSSLSLSKEALIWGIISAFALAANNLIPGRLMHKYGTLSVTGWSMLLAGIMLSCYVQPWHVVGDWDLKGLGAMCVVIIVGTILSFSLYLEGVRLAGAQTASLLASVEPVTAAIVSVIMMGVTFTFAEVFGIVLIVIAVTLLSLKKSKS